MIVPIIFPPAMLELNTPKIGSIKQLIAKTPCIHNNFLMDYLKNEINSKRKDAMIEWHKLKELNIPKDYKSWKKYMSKK